MEAENKTGGAEETKGKGRQKEGERTRYNGFHVPGDNKKCWEERKGKAKIRRKDKVQGVRLRGGKRDRRERKGGR